MSAREWTACSSAEREKARGAAGRDGEGVGARNMLALKCGQLFILFGHVLRSFQLLFKLPHLHLSELAKIYLARYALLDLCRCSCVGNLGIALTIAAESSRPKTNLEKKGIPISSSSSQPGSKLSNFSTDFNSGKNSRQM